MRFLRLIIAIFEEQGFKVLGAHEVLPGLTVEEGLFAGPEPSEGAASGCCLQGDGYPSRAVSA